MYAKFRINMLTFVEIVFDKSSQTNCSDALYAFWSATSLFIMIHIMPNAPCRRRDVIWCRRTYCRDHSTVRRPVSEYFQTTTLWIRRYPKNRLSR